MSRLKTLCLVSLLVILFTAAVLILSYHASPKISTDHITSLQTRYEAFMDEKLVNAETSLLKQGELAASDPKIVHALSEVRSKLLTATSDELKSRTNNTWNEGIFNALLAWRNKQASAVTTELSQRHHTASLPHATAQVMFPPSSWWKRAPDLALAFAITPLNDGTLASTLTAYGMEGKMLRAGKRFDLDNQLVAEVQKTGKPDLGLFVWDEKMYVAVSYPVLHEDTHIGQIVLGMELSRETLEIFAADMPKHMSLRMYYQQQKHNKSVIVPSDQDKTLLALKNNTFVPASSYGTGNAEAVDLSQITLSKAYISDKDDHLLALSRFRWMWDENWESGFYLVSDLDHASATWNTFRKQVMLIGFLMLLLGLIGTFIFTNAYQKRLNELKLALLEAISSGNPLDAKAFSCLPGIEDANLGRYIIKPVDEGKANDASIDIKMLLMDIDEDAEEGASEAEPSMSPEAAKDAHVDPEMKSLYETYMAKRHETGNDTPMSYEQFLRRINRNIDKIKQTHPHTDITFSVTVQNGKVVLTPSLKK